MSDIGLSENGLYGAGHALLSVRNLSTDLRADGRVVNAARQVSFDIMPGETFCLVGESGSGKSVTALSIMRLLPPDIASHPSGEILFAGRDVLNMPEEDLRHLRGGSIAMIFQEPMTSLNPVLSIGEQISEAVQLHHPALSPLEVEARTLAALEQVQIPGAAERMRDYPHQLSGGQRQRVMIAMALACEPKLLIADEPTTALDVTVQAGILELLHDLQQRTGMSMLFITHDFAVVAQIAQRVGVMRHGHLVEVGPCGEVLRNPRHAYTRQLLAALPENLAKPVAFTPLQAANLDAAGSLPEPLVTIRELQVWFPVRKGLLKRTVDYVRAVDGVSLDVEAGCIVALVGESGCGKTTLGRALLQLERPTGGSVRLGGRELCGLSARELRPLRRGMQMVFQDPQSSLNPRLLVETALTEPMRAHGIGVNQEERIELAARVLERVQIGRAHV